MKNHLKCSHEDIATQIGLIESEENAVRQSLTFKVKANFSSITKNKFICDLCRRFQYGSFAAMKRHLVMRHEKIAKEIGLLEESSEREITFSENGEMGLMRGSRDTKFENQFQIDDELSLPVRKKLKNDKKPLPDLENNQFESFEPLEVDAKNPHEILEFSIKGIDLKHFTQPVKLIKLLTTASAKIHMKIKQELKGKRPCLSIFKARGIFSITAHFIDDFELKIRQLGCVKAESTDLIAVREFIKKAYKVDIARIHMTEVCSEGFVDDKNLLLVRAQEVLQGLQLIFNQQKLTHIEEEVVQDKQAEKVYQVSRDTQDLVFSFCGSRALRNVAKKVTAGFNLQCEKIKKIVKYFKNLRPKVVDSQRWDHMLVFFKSLRGFEELTLDWNFIEEYCEVFEPLNATMKEIDGKKMLFGEFCDL